MTHGTQSAIERPFICLLRMHIEFIFMEYEYVIKSNVESLLLLLPLLLLLLLKPIRSDTLQIAPFGIQTEWLRCRQCSNVVRLSIGLWSLQM